MSEHVTVIGDIGDPLSLLASQRIDRLSSAGVAVRFVAVEADPSRPMTGRRLDDETARLAAALSLPGEVTPRAGTDVPNTRAATAAYAESLTDGCADRMRRALFDALWVNGRRVDDPDVIRRIAVGVLNPVPAAEDVDTRIRANHALIPLGGADELATTRRLGLLVSMARGPLTEVGQRRIDSWRRLWHAEGRRPLPVVLTPLGEALAGPDALRWLAAHLPATVPTPRRADTTPASAPAPAGVR